MYAMNHPAIRSGSTRRLTLAAIESASCSEDDAGVIEDLLDVRSVHTSRRTRAEREITRAIDGRNDKMGAAHNVRQMVRGASTTSFKPVPAVDGQLATGRRVVQGQVLVGERAAPTSVGSGVNEAAASAAKRRSRHRH